LFNYFSSISSGFYISYKNLISDEGMLCCHTINTHKIENKHILKTSFCTIGDTHLFQFNILVFYDNNMNPIEIMKN
jgi:hypothetical protein